MAASPAIGKPADTCVFVMTVERSVGGLEKCCREQPKCAWKVDFAVDSGSTVAMPSVFAPLSIPLRLLEDVRSIAESLTALPRLIDELIALSRRMEAMQEDVRGLREDLEPLPEGISRMLAELGGMRSDFASVPGTVERLAADLAEVLVNVRPMDADLSEVESAVRGLSPQLTGIRAELDRLRSDLARLPFIGKS